MIIARLVGDQAVLAWLRTTPDLAASGLARAIATLGIQLQNRIQQGDRPGSLGSSTSLQLDQTDDRIAATVSSDSGYVHAHGYGAVGVGAKLRRATKAFGRPRPRKAINARSAHRGIEVPKPSFLNSALEDMDPAIRDAVEAALRETLTR